MRNWMNVAQTLREVRSAHEEFAVRSVIDQTIIGPMLDRVAEDLFDNFSFLHVPKLQRGRLKDDES